MTEAKALLVGLGLAASGCSDPDPAIFVEHLYVEADSHIRSPRVVVDGGGLALVTWTEEHAREGDEAAQRDVAYRVWTDAAGLDETTKILTPWGGAQTDARPFWSGERLSVGWTDGRVEGSTGGGGSFVWGDLQDPHEPWGVGAHAGHRDVSNVAVLDRRALVVVRATDPGPEHTWHAVLFETRNGAVIADVPLPGGAFSQDEYGVTAGDSGWLLLRHSQEGQDDHGALDALVLDFEGAVLRGPERLGERFPPPLEADPIRAVWTRERWVYPWLDYERVEVDRPCFCLGCPEPQPETCTIDDYHTSLHALRATGPIEDLGCFDCRTDVGPVVPRLVSDGETIFAHADTRETWHSWIVAVRDLAPPPFDEWMPLVTTDIDLSGYEDMVLTPEHLLLVGTTYGNTRENAKLAIGVVPRAELP
jgi:hypothetical protein